MNVCMLFCAGALSLSVLVGCGGGGDDSPNVGLSPDLAVSDAYATPSSPAQGTNFTMSFTVSNLGVEESSASTLTLFKKSTGDANFVQFTSRDIPKILRNSPIQVIFTTSPVDASDVATSPVIIRAVISTVPGDSNAANNTREFSISFTAAAMAPSGSG